jgi:hypothetical protein
MVAVRYRGLHDDRGENGEVEADFIIESHRELPDLIGRIASADA